MLEYRNFLLQISWGPAAYRDTRNPQDGNRKSSLIGQLFHNYTTPPFPPHFQLRRYSTEVDVGVGVVAMECFAPLSRVYLGIPSSTV